MKITFKKVLPLIFLGIIFIPLYIFWQTKSIYGGDAGDLVTAASVFGIAHPPGYPLYTFLGGLLIRWVSFFTPAWRVGLLSSIPSALTLICFFLLLKKITKEDFVSLIGTFTLGFSYLFWLYSEVPEVFSLNNFFSLLLCLILFIWQKNPKNLRLFYLFSFIFGLAFSHHQIILFLTPAFFYLFWLNKKQISKSSKFLVLISLVFFLGFAIPYLYAYFAALRQPVLNWNNPVNLKNLFNLITRQTYGTFRSGNVILETPLERLNNILLFFSFLRLDFSDLGIILAIAGAYWLFKKNRQNFYFFLLAFLFTGPIFHFYAGFPTVNEFGLAIFERFLILPEIFWVIFITCGFWFLKEKLVNLNFLKLIFLVFPLFLFYYNFPKISILKNDFSAENLGRDILKTVPKKGILILSQDTPLFNTQYVYFALKERQNIYLFHLAMMVSSYYKETVKKNYPELYVSKEKIGSEFLLDFIEKNSENHSVYTNFIFPGLSGHFVPDGLLLRYYKKNLPSIAEVKKRNRTLWQSYHQPLNSSLKKYKNLMLFDIVKVYLVGVRETAQSMFNAGEYKEALFYYKKAKEFDRDSFRSDYDLAKTYLLLKNCSLAEKHFLLAEKKENNVPEIYLGLSKVYQECFKDKSKANFYLRIYEEKKKKIEVPIEKL